MSHRHPARLRTRVLGGAFAALAVVGGAVTAVTVQDPPAEVRLAQNATDQKSSTMTVGEAVSLDLRPIVANAAGGTVPPGATLQVTGLPDGLTQDGWVISGTPTRAGTYDVNITVSLAGQTESREVQLVVVEPGAEAPAATGAPTTATGATTTAPAATGATTTAPAATGATTTAADGAGEITTSAATTTPAQAPDLCAAFSGGQVDGSGLALALAPLLGEQGQNPLVSGLLGVLAQILPGLLGGASGSLGGDAGSLGQVVCAVAPSGAGASTVPTSGATTATTTTAATTTAGAPQGLGGAAALAGLLGGGTGSLGGN